MTKKKKILTISLTLFFVLGILYYKFFVLNWHPPRFFSTNDPNGIYSIRKEHSPYPSDHDVYYVTYTGKEQVFYDEDKKEYYEILVGSSPVSLDSFVGSPVRLEGDFVYGKWQCVANDCVPLGNLALFNIQKIDKK